MPGSRSAGMERLLLGRALGVDDELEWLVVDDDRRRGSPGLLGMLGGDQRDRLAEVAHAVDREHRLIRELEPVMPVAGHVLVREHRVNAGHRHRLGDVDPADARMRVRAAKRVAPEHPRRHQVARVRELAGRLRDTVHAHDALADAAELEPPCTAVLTERPPACTASRIFW